MSIGGSVGSWFSVKIRECRVFPGERAELSYGWEGPLHGQLPFRSTPGVGGGVGSRAVSNDWNKERAPLLSLGEQKEFRDLVRVPSGSLAGKVFPPPMTGGSLLHTQVIVAD